MAEVIKVKPEIPYIIPKKRVAAYARVSKETERTIKSYRQQVDYYTSYIKSNPEWVYVKTYSDEAITGTSKSKRPGFLQMIADCEAGKIDLILTKTIARFSRNTADLLETVRHLKDLNIEVWFEMEGIRTLSTEGELILTLMASCAQVEIEDMSENIKLAIHKKFRRGVLNGVRPFLGYRWNKDKECLEVVPEEAEVVKRIFDLCISGKPTREVARILNQDGVPPMRGEEWNHGSVKYVLMNVSYTGNLLLQKTYAESPLTGRKWNKGERPKFYSEGSHEAIVSLETFEAAQKKLEYYKEEGCYSVLSKYPFSQVLKCAECGKSYRRGTRTTKYGKTYFWACRTQLEGSRKDCDSKVIPEMELYRITCELLEMDRFNEEEFHERVDHIVVMGDDQLDFHLTDGTVIHQKWETTLFSKKGRENAKRYYDSGDHGTIGSQKGDKGAKT